MAGSLAALMAAVALYCLARLSVPALRARGERRDLDAWHGVMAAAMAVMLLVPPTRLPSVVGLGVFVVGVGWAAARGVRRANRRAYLGVGVGCAVMVAMLSPPATATAATRAVGLDALCGPVRGTHSPPAVATVAVEHSGIAPPTFIVAGLLLALGALLVLRLPGLLRRDAGVRARLEACCDLAMAGAMAYMLMMSA